MTEKIRNAYQTLELPDGAGLPQVQKAWREMVQVWHPDRFPRNPDLQRKAQERTKQINNAYDILKRYLIDGDIPRPRPSKQSQKQESEQRTSQQETASDDSQSSQTHEEENRQKQTTKPFQERSPAAEIGGIIFIIFAIIIGAIGGYLIGWPIVILLDWMIEAASGWSFIDRANPWIETLLNKTLIIASFIVTFFVRIIDTIRAKRQNRPFIGIHEGWFAYTTIGVCGGTIGGIVCGLPVSIIGNEAITSIAAFIGAAVGARLALSVRLRLVRFLDAFEEKYPEVYYFFVLAGIWLFLRAMLKAFLRE